METLKVFSLIFLLAGAWLFMSNDDYHKMFDRPQTVRYNCDMLLGGWHPDFPIEVIAECRKLKRENI